MRVRPSFKLCPVLLLTASLACDFGGEDNEVLRVDSAGIEIVESTGKDRALKWTLQREFELGGKEAGPESFFTVGPLTVDVDGGGRIHVLNTLESHVVIFSPEGEWIRTVGGPGEGPGEISMAASLAVASDGTVSVFDFGKGGFVRFDPDGEPLSNLPFLFFPWPGTARHVARTSEGYLVAAMGPSLEENTSRHVLQLISANDTAVVAERSFPRPEMSIFPSCGGGLSLPPIFEVQISWDVQEDTIVVSQSDLYEFQIFENGRLARRARRRLGPRPATEEMAMEELGEGYTINFGQGPCTIPPGEMVQSRGFSGTIPWIEQVALSPGGEVWVERRRVGEDAPGVIDIFDASGAYQGTLPEGTPFPLVFLDEDRFGGAETDAADVGRLVVFRVRRLP